MGFLNVLFWIHNIKGSYGEKDRKVNLLRPWINLDKGIRVILSLLTVKSLPFLIKSNKVGKA